MAAHGPRRRARPGENGSRRAADAVDGDGAHRVVNLQNGIEEVHGDGQQQSGDDADGGGVKMTRVDILCKMERFDALKRAMFNIGITGMTATNVMGCGEQRGKTEGYFRGAKVRERKAASLYVCYRYSSSCKAS